MTSDPQSVSSSRSDELLPIAMDGHVHIQRAMPWDQIARNFATAAPKARHVCLVTESAGMDRFAELAPVCDTWGELGLKHREFGLRFIAGRQVVSAEGLEVLLIGSRDQSTEGLPAEQVIALGLQSGAAVCLPWGFGKWIGKRRRLAADLHARLSQQVIFGDITNRPLYWHEPLFAGHRVLRGSDNLPLSNSSDTVGQFGSIIAPQSEVENAGDLIAMLRDRNVPLLPYGKRKSARVSIGEQLRLRFGKAA